MKLTKQQIRDKYKLPSFTLAIEVGKYGGFYIVWQKNAYKAICLGWISFIYAPHEFNDILKEYYDIEPKWDGIDESFSKPMEKW